jgi:hypothetical protein
MVIPRKINNYSLSTIRKLAQDTSVANITVERHQKKPVPQISHPKSFQKKPEAQKKFEKISSFEDIAIKYANFLDKLGSSLFPVINNELNKQSGAAEEVTKMSPWLKKWIKRLFAGAAIGGGGYYFGYRSAKKKYGPAESLEVPSPYGGGEFATPEQYGG